MKRKMSNSIRPMKNIWINEQHDTDRDGVPNFRDCQPFNPWKQDKKSVDNDTYDPHHFSKENKIKRYFYRAFTEKDICPKCGKTFLLDEKDKKIVSSGVHVYCPECSKKQDEYIKKEYPLHESDEKLSRREWNRKYYRCPRCGSPNMRRIGSGHGRQAWQDHTLDTWKCRRCGHVFKGYERDAEFSRRRERSRKKVLTQRKKK